MFKKIVVGLLALFVAVSITDLSFGRGGRSGGGFSSGSRSSSSSRGSSGFGGSRSSSKPSTSAPKSSSTPRGSGGFSSSKPSKPSTTSTPAAKKQNNLSSTDTKLYQKAQQQGTAFKSRSEAQTAFKQKHSEQYTSKFAAEPKTRPAHIPQSTTVNNKTYNINYDQSRGGYGYWNGGGPGLGTWIMYDMFSDAIMMNAMMSNHGYYYGAAPVASVAPVAPVTTGTTTTVVTTHSVWNPFTVFLVVVFVVLLAIGLVGIFINK